MSEHACMIKDCSCKYDFIKIQDQEFYSALDETTRTWKEYVEAIENQELDRSSPEFLRQT